MKFFVVLFLRRLVRRFDSTKIRWQIIWAHIDQIHRLTPRFILILFYFVLLPKSFWSELFFGFFFFNWNSIDRYTVNFLFVARVLSFSCDCKQRQCGKTRIRTKRTIEIQLRFTHALKIEKRFTEMLCSFVFWIEMSQNWTCYATNGANNTDAESIFVCCAKR